MFHAHAYDAMNMLFEAIESGGGRERRRFAVDPADQALRDAVFATSGYEGITGTITCNELGDCATSVTIGVFEAPGVGLSRTRRAKPVFT